jgi:6-phosphogluconolactonase
MRVFRQLIAGACLPVLFAACSGGSDITREAPQRVFAQTNETRNALLMFTRNADGTLTAPERFTTGGSGTDGKNFASGDVIEPDSLTSIHSLLLAKDQHLLFVANSGDATVSVFRLNPQTNAPTLLSTTSTGTRLPTSLAYRSGTLYVSHQTGDNQLVAMRVDANGTLSRIGSYTLVQPDALTTSIVVAPDGQALVANTPIDRPDGTLINAISVFPILNDGRLGNPSKSTAQSDKPFGGRFARGTLESIYVSADASGAVNTYRLDGGRLDNIAGPTLTERAQSCWPILTPDNRFVFIGNGDGTVTSLTLDQSGKTSLLQPIAAQEPATGRWQSSLAGDSWISEDGQYLYQTYLGADKVVAYRIEPDGKLTKLNEQPARTATGLSLQGLVGT